jgi:hypothetical protein
MNFEVNGRSKTRSNFLKQLATFYIKELKLTKSKYDLSIFLEPKLCKNQAVDGLVFRLHDSTHVIMILDSAMSVQDTVKTFAHEMVHVKQIARGQMSFKKKRNGSSDVVWMGKVHKKHDIYESPWEIEAYSKELVLANKVFKMLVPKKQQKTKKSSKKSTKR